SARGWDSLSRSLLQLCVGCAAFSVCVCAAQPRTIDKDELSRIKTIGVISTFGDKFHMFERGLTVFQNRESAHPIPEWKIDDEAVLITKRVLGRTFGIVPITTARISEINEALHASVYKEEFRMLTEDDKRVIRKAITDVLEASISLTLKELGLTVE